MLAAVVEFLAGLLHGTGEAVTGARRGRRLVIGVMLTVLVGGGFLLLVAL